MAVAAVVVMVVWDVPPIGLAALLSNNAFHPYQRSIALTIQAFMHVGGFTLAPLLLLAFTLQPRDYGLWLRAQGRVSAAGLLAGAALTLVSLPLISVTIEWNAGWHFGGLLTGFDAWMRAAEDTARRVTAQITQMDSGAAFAACFVTLAVIPAIGEELVFRGIVQPTLTRAVGGRVHVGIWLTAIVFSAIHMQFLGFVPRMLLGAGFGYLYQWSGRLSVPIAAHLANNGLQVLLLYLSQRGALAGFDPDATAALPWPWVLVSASATVTLLRILRRTWVAPSPSAELPAAGV
jgi:uncharacterized protein